MTKLLLTCQIFLRSDTLTLDTVIDLWSMRHTLKFTTADPLGVFLVTCPWGLHTQGFTQDLTFLIPVRDTVSTPKHSSPQ